MSEATPQSSLHAQVLIRRATPADGPAVQRFVFDPLRSYGIEPDPEGLDADVVAFGTAGDSPDLPPDYGPDRTYSLGLPLRTAQSEQQEH